MGTLWSGALYAIGKTAMKEGNVYLVSTVDICYKVRKWAQARRNPVKEGSFPPRPSL